MNSSSSLKTRKWEIINKLKAGKIIKILLANRGLQTKKEIAEFLHPKLKDVTIEKVGIDKQQLKKAIQRIETAIKNKEQIVVFGDYDVDGICGTAILWEVLNGRGARVMPYIPHRIEEGYGLSVKAMQSSEFRVQNPRLIITVDNGIVANEAVVFANEQGIDVIITDHHVPSRRLPKAHAIVHTTKLCGAGVAWMLAQQFKINEEKHLELVALATIADLVPLTGSNRTLTKYGIEKLRKTKRAGLLALFREAALNKDEIGVYEIGHMIAPRLNAMGRLAYGMESLRLLCTTDPNRAQSLAHKIGSTNRERQQVTEETVLHAMTGIRNRESEMKKLLFIAHESYQQGVIGLVAGRLVEEFYRPTIVIAKGKTYSKASARSVAGFNIIEFIRGASELLVDAGGHPMAAGFTVETAKVLQLQDRLEKEAEKLLDNSYLVRTVRIDCELPLSQVNEKLYEGIQNLAPFGMGNPEPTFLIKRLLVEDMRLVGREARHVKFVVTTQDRKYKIDAIAFGMGDRLGQFHIGDSIDIVCVIDENRWNGTRKLQLKVRDVRLS